MLGTVHHECSLTPSLKQELDVAAYKNIMQTRSKEAAEPKRTIKSLDVDAGTANQLASGARLGSFKSSLGKGFGVSLSFKPRVRKVGTDTPLSILI